MPGDNSREVSLEVDTDKQDIRSFLESLSKEVAFTDISVKELPMDMIITRIYEE